MTRRVGFLFLGPAAHIAHAATVAFELDALPGFESVGLISSDIHAAHLASLAARYGSGCTIERLYADPLHRLMRLFKNRPYPRVRYVIGHNRRRLGQFDALVCTDAHELALGPGRRPEMILAGHGAGLRAHGQYPGLDQFGLFLLPGRTKLERLEQMGYVHERQSRIIGYPKFDLAIPEAERSPLFPNAAPIVLYNPHFNSSESSWHRWGRQVLDHFLDRPELNLIVAPHTLLFARSRRQLPAKYLRASNIHVDTGSEALIDMRYTRLADIYLGDVSSQVYEFAGYRPRPCVFLDPHQRRWMDNGNLAMWRMGQVVDDIGDLDQALRVATARFAGYRSEQQRLMALAFDKSTIPAGRRGARAIAEWLGMPVGRDDRQAVPTGGLAA